MPTINPEKWHEVKEIFYAALRQSPEERERFLDKSCKDDDRLRREVESLLSSSEAAGSFMQNPAVGEIAEAVAGSNEKLCVNQSLSHYKIISLLGAGGMGEVFLAEDTRLHRQVALKVLPENIAADAERLRRFEQEAGAASALNHPNILTVHEFGLAAGIHFLATEFVDGETLREKINEAELSLTDSLNIAEQTAFALSTAHASGIIHRDIKPENIMIRRDRIVKVVDFGLAKLIEKKVVISDAEAETRALVQTQPGVIMGTASYMSPEQARGKETDARTDTFSLGIVLYEMLTGHLPFAGETISDSIAAILTREPPPLAEYISNVPTELQRIVRKALTKERDERYQTARDLMIDLKTLRRDLDLRGELERSATPNEKREPINGQDSDQRAQIPAKEKQTDLTVAVSTIEDQKANIGDQNLTNNKHTWQSAIRNRKRLAALAVFGVLGLGCLWFYLWRENAKPAPPAPVKTIAVLPFKPLVAANRDEALELGMADTLISKLSGGEEIIVRPLDSVRRSISSNQDSLMVGRELAVEAVLDGNIQTSGERIRISARLLRTSDGKQLWAGQFDEKFTDIFAVQDSISERVVAALQTRLGSREKKQQTENVEAYQLYMKGRFHASRLIQPETAKGIAYFQQAIEIDPNYALAYVALSNTFRQFTLTSDVPSSETMPKAKAAALRAIEIDETLDEAHIALGIIAYWYDWDWQSAEKHYLRAIELDPNNAHSHRAYAHFLSTTAQHEKALVEAKRGRKLDPLTLSSNALEGQYLFYAGKPDEALDQLNKTIDLDANFWLAHLIISRVYAEKGMHAEAIAAATKAKELSKVNSESIALIGYSLAKSGETEKARAVLEELLKLSATRYVPPYNFALVYNGLGETDKALDYLEKGFTEKDVRMVFLKVELKWNNLRNEPRFVDLMRRMNFE